MKRYLRMMFALLMVVAVMFAYTGISFAADDGTTDVNGGDTPAVEPVDNGDGQGGTEPTTEPTTTDTGDTSGTEPANDPAANGDGGTTGDTGSNTDPSTGGEGGTTAGEPTRDAVTYTITWKNWDGTELEKDEGVAPGETPTYDGDTPVKEEDETSTYTFTGWTPEVAEVTGDAEYTATFEAADKIKIASVTLAYTAVKYDGAAKTPAATVKDAEGNTVAASDYTVSYSANTNAGTATVTVTAKNPGKYTGSATANFYIVGSVAGLKSASATSSAITASWNKYTATPVSGYKVYLNGKLYTTVSGTSYTFRSLATSRGYTIGVAPYYGSVIGPIANKTMYTAPVAPGKVTLKKAKTNKPYVKLTYKASTKNVVGYQVQYSIYSNFSSPGYYTYSGASKKVVNVPNLINGKKYFFRVRAYNVRNGVYSYGPWSNARSAKAKSSGWISGKRYYAVNGVLLKGYHKVGGERYYFDEVTGENGGASKEIWNEIKRSKSKTKYLVSVSIKNHRVNVFTRKSGKWVIKYQWKCITGMNDTTEKGEKFTPRGSWIINGKKLKYMSNKGHTCYLATNFYGGCYIHSELYAPEMTMKKIIDGKLGESRSSGCVRVQYKNAQWVYKNIKKGTRVISRFA